MQPANLWLSRYAKLVVIVTLALITVGGTVTTHKAGLAVPDWPTSFGHNMFALPWEYWEGDALLEHSHRLLGSVLGMLIIGLLIWVLKAEARPWVRKLAWASLVLVIAQGIMGGKRVTDISVEWAIIHGCTAQAFFCLTILIALALSPEWTRPLTGGVNPQAIKGWKTLAWVGVAAIFIQLILGAVMRHLDAGLAIPTFPLMPDGSFFPKVHDARIDIHFTHRLWAVVVTGIVAVLVAKVMHLSGGDRRLSRPSLTLAALVITQIALGASIIRTTRAPHPTTLHVVNGAIVLGLCFMLAVRANRFSKAETLPPQQS